VHVEFSNAQNRISHMRELPGRIIYRVKQRDCISKFLSLADHIELLKHDAIAETLINPCPETKELVMLLDDLKGSVHDLLDYYTKILTFEQDTNHEASS
jgi:hypothetical protein